MNLSRLPKRIFGYISKYVSASDNLTIISGADAPFYDSLKNNLLLSIQRYEPDAFVIIWDLGLNDNQRADLENFAEAWKGKLSVYKYPENELPSHYAMANWNYAFKGYCIYNSLPVIRTKSAMWLDAGCGIASPLKAEKNIIYLYGYYSPYSSTTVGELTCPSIKKKFMAEQLGIASKQMLSGGVQGWNMRSNKAMSLLCEWASLICSKDNISPIDADLSNHRYDQSLLSIMYYSRYKELPYFCRYLYNIRIHLNKH